ncbi:peptidoglycan-binding domain-containing protein [Kitasatospora sp. NBC_01302]|uniref:peptidoglycan-binding domain-containing protein n=1 Tax=Kitasatospora sp. NBC_01302 TaxID=2903575 RepID=UPI002E0EBB8A|nr:peptidoglycan-binding protein [Kitasatospora sp. NBC_01302]
MPGFAPYGPGPEPDGPYPGLPQHPDVTETAVLPLLEGPPLVRPYVPPVAVTDEVAPPHVTAVLPPVPDAAPAPPSAPARELGLFPLAGDLAPAGGGRAANRRARGRGSRRGGVIAAAGAGVVALGVGLAFALSPGPQSNHEALPVLPTGAPDPAPSPSQTPQSAPTTAAASTAPTSSAPATSARPTSAAPRPVTRTVAPATTQAPAPPPAAPATTAAPAPAPSSAPPSTQAPVTTAPPTSAAPSSPSPSASFQTLHQGDSGPAVTTLQQQLRAAGCGNRFTPGTYDNRTVQAVQYFQDQNNVGDYSDYGVYDQQTRDALAAGDTCY